MRLRGRAGIGSAAHLAAGLGIVGVAGYVYVAVVGRVFSGAEGAAQVSALISIYLLINIIGPGFFTALEQETSRAVSAARARGQHLRASARRAAVLAVTASAVLLGCVLLAWPSLLGQVFGGEVGLLAALLIATAGSAAVYWARGVLGGQQRFAAYSVTFYVEGAARLLPLLVLLVAAVPDPAWYGLVFALGSVVAAVVVAPTLRMPDRPDAVVARPEGMGRSFCLLVGATALSQLIANLGPVVVTYRLPYDTVAASVFASTFVLARVPLFLFAPVLAVLLPRFTRDVVQGEFERFARDLRRTVLLLLLVGGVGVVAGSTLGPWAVQVLFNSVARPTAGTMAVLGGATVLVMFALVLQAALVALGRQAAVSTGWVLGAVVFVVILVSPLPPLVGALVAQIVGPAVVVGYLGGGVLRALGRSDHQAESTATDAAGTVAPQGRLRREAQPPRSCGVLGQGRVNEDVWVVIPVFNEAPVLESVVRQVLTVFPNVVCVDDGSGDGSAEVVLRTGAHLVRHPVNLGQGAALQTGLTYARVQPGAQYFITYDADGQHRLEDAAAMVEVARSGEADVVLGTRFADQAASVPLVKRLVLRVAVLLSPAGRKLRLTDAHNGLRVLTRPVADDLQITMNGMAHASEIVSYLGRSKWRVREIPVSIRYTEYSRSKGQSLLNGVNILFDLSVRHRGG